jgi:hypothetical protein
MNTQHPINTVAPDAFFRQPSGPGSAGGDLPDPLGKLMYAELNAQDLALVQPSDWKLMVVGVAVVLIGYVTASWLDAHGTAQEDLQRAEALAQGRAEGEALARQEWTYRVVAAYKQGVADEFESQAFRARQQGCPAPGNLKQRSARPQS